LSPSPVYRQSSFPETASQQTNPSSPAGKNTLPPTTAGCPSVCPFAALNGGSQTAVSSFALTQKRRQLSCSCSPSPQYTRPLATVGVQNTGRSPGGANDHSTRPLVRLTPRSQPRLAPRSAPK
jgi:hypothetical protein